MYYLFITLLLFWSFLNHITCSINIKQNYSIIYLRVVNSDGYENYCGYIDPVSSPALPSNFYPASAKEILDKSSNTGCNGSDATVFNSACENRILLLSRGGCTFGTKAKNAISVNAAGVIFVSSVPYDPAISVNTSVPMPPQFLAAMISKVSYSSIKGYLPAKMAPYQPVGNLKENNRIWMLFVLYFFALTSVILGSVLSGFAQRSQIIENLSQPFSQNSPAPLTVEKPLEFVVLLVIMISIPVGVLFALVYAFDYVIWVLLVVYGIIVTTTLNHFFSKLALVLLKFRKTESPSSLSLKRSMNCGRCGSLPYHNIDFVTLPFALTASIVWFVFRNSHWAFIYTDILNVLICMRILETIWLRMKFITVLFILFLLYDVFFVFVTPYFSSSGSDNPSTDVSLYRSKRDTVVDYYMKRHVSFMEKVATGTAGLSGENFPVSFRMVPYPIPDSISTCDYPFALLGLGDAIVPGLLLSYNFFYDLSWGRKTAPYFLVSLLGYSIGLIITATVLVVFKSGQPALLYIIPFSLGFSYLLALFRKDIAGYWNCQLPSYMTSPSAAAEVANEDVEEVQPEENLTLPLSPEKNPHVQVEPPRYT